ncbi:PH domain-containing protein [Haloferula sp. BvORR071]|uniref:PH domain-containing protein n=1 Tax=Haloferula sp. BvORR071 TaxID=1396141 RepID=UPI0005502EAB|nr:PH domain-containing protein [Haloferula sp. BvORR071]
MYSAFRQLAERWLRIPPEPEAPPGDESSARVFRAAPKYLQYLKVLWGIGTAFSAILALIPLAIILGVIFGSPGSAAGDGMIAVMIVVEILLIASLVAHALFRLAIVHLDFEKRWYLVTDRSLRIREGVTNVREITFTFANIQNLSVTQGPIQRMLGIADLKVETAGGGAVTATSQHQTVGLNLHTAYFRGIDNAEEVKNLIAARMRGHKDSGLGDRDDHHHSAPPALPAANGLAFNAALEEVLAEARALRQAAASR